MSAYRRAGRLIETAADWQNILTIAEDLSIVHTRNYLTRSLDLLHVATALELKCKTFVSGDRRQLKAARAAKFRPVDITRSRAATIGPRQTAAGRVRRQQTGTSFPPGRGKRGYSSVQRRGWPTCRLAKSTRVRVPRFPPFLDT